MITEKYITWSVGNGWIAVYTETPEVRTLLWRMFGRLTTYERNGRVFAWQTTITKDKLKVFQNMVETGTMDKKKDRRARYQIWIKDRGPQRGSNIPKEGVKL